MAKISEKLPSLLICRLQPLGHLVEGVHNGPHSSALRLDSHRVVTVGKRTRRADQIAYRHESAEGEAAKDCSCQHKDEGNGGNHEPHPRRNVKHDGGQHDEQGED